MNEFTICPRGSCPTDSLQGGHTIKTSQTSCQKTACHTHAVAIACLLVLVGLGIAGLGAYFGGTSWQAVLCYAGGGATVLASVLCATLVSCRTQRADKSKLSGPCHVNNANFG